MKKFAVNYLLTPYLKYGNSSIFPYLFIGCVSISLLSQWIIYDYFIVKVIQFLCMIINITGTLFLSVKFIGIKWSDMTNKQKLLYGEKEGVELTFNQNCEWVRLYGNKIKKG